jgi:hypothetical protein
MTEAATIARRLGGRKSADGFICHCPVQSHGKGRGDRNRSLFVKDGDKATLFTCFAGCKAGDVLTALRSRGLCEALAEREPPEPNPFIPEHKPDPEAIELWRGAIPIKDDAIQARYLRARGITIEPPASLRATAMLHLGRYPLPAIVAAVQAPDRRIIAVQTTLIDPQGERKASVAIPRRTVGALGLGAIRLAAATDVLGLAEGTEKALAAMQLFNVPCWASLGAGRMHRVGIPDKVTALHVFLDNDDAGRAAGERTAYANRTRKVVLHFPPDQFKDWDDVTRARANERSAA